ncbi:MAG: LysM peptidoglycan-binding domain-containing protein [Firmicutes bacterium]|nr:LysM peptidoglycan-binding domain-containing protein [Bacillota bacterium]
MENTLKVSAVAISAKGKGMNLDNIYVNGRYLAQDNNEPQALFTKTSSVDFQMYGVCDGENAEDVAIRTSPSVIVMQRMQQLQSVLSIDGAISREKIWNFLYETNGKLREYQAQVGSEGITSSFAGLFLHKNRGLAVHLGDSRIYVIRGGRMLQITEDHLEATDLYKYGVLTQEQAEVHKLNSRPTATLGMYDIEDAESLVFSKYFIFYPGDIFIICTDGITDSVSNAEIESVVRQAKDSPKEVIAQQLLQMARDKNDDDKSIIVLEVEEVNGDAAAAKAPAAKPETDGAKKTGLGASIAAIASKVDGSSDDKANAAAKPETQDNDGDEGEEGEEKPGFFAGLAAMFSKKDQDEEEDEEDEEELTLLDRIFGNPKLIFAILGIVIIIVLMALLLSSLAKGCKGGNESSKPAVESSAIVEPSKPDTSKQESSKQESSKQESSKQESSKQESSKEESSKEESSKEESSKEESSKEESSKQESSREESSRQESSKEESSKQEEYSQSEVATYRVAEGDTLYAILMQYYDEFSDELLNSFCKYNGIKPEDPIQIGQQLQIPPRSELN